MRRKRPWARFLGSPAARVPILHGRPDMFAGALRLIAQIVDIEAVDHAIFHADVAIDDNRIDVVADAALDQALDGIANRAITQGLPATKIDDQNIRQGRPKFTMSLEGYYSMKTHVMVRFGRWQEIIDEPLPDDPGLY